MSWPRLVIGWYNLTNGVELFWVEFTIGLHGFHAKFVILNAMVDFMWPVCLEWFKKEGEK